MEEQASALFGGEQPLDGLFDCVGILSMGQGGADLVSSHIVPTSRAMGGESMLREGRFFDDQLAALECSVVRGSWRGRRGVDECWKDPADREKPQPATEEETKEKQWRLLLCVCCVCWGCWHIGCLVKRFHRWVWRDGKQA